MKAPEYFFLVNVLIFFRFFSRVKLRTLMFFQLPLSEFVCSRVWFCVKPSLTSFDSR